jgi:hypothetical protein
LAYTVPCCQAPYVPLRIHRESRGTTGLAAAALGQSSACAAAVAEQVYVKY